MLAVVVVLVSGFSDITFSVSVADAFPMSALITISSLILIPFRLPIPAFLTASKVKQFELIIRELLLRIMIIRFIVPHVCHCMRPLLVLQDCTLE